MRIPKLSFILFSVVFTLISCRKDKTDVSDINDYYCLEHPQLSGDYFIYQLDTNLSPFKFGPYQQFNFDMNCDGKNDFNFSSHIQMYDPGSGYTYHGLNPLHGDAFIYLNTSIDTTYRYHDTITGNESNGVYYRYIENYDCSIPSSVYSIHEINQNYILPHLHELAEPTGGKWQNEFAQIKNSNTFLWYAEDDTSSVDTSYYWYRNEFKDCHNFTSGQAFYIHFRVDQINGPIFGYAKMSSSFVIEHIGIKHQ